MPPDWFGLDSGLQAAAGAKPIEIQMEISALYIILKTVCFHKWWVFFLCHMILYSVYICFILKYFRFEEIIFLFNEC